MEEKQQRHIIDIIFVLALFCLFALSAIFLITIGADIYGKTVDNMEGNFNARTALAYVTEKVRQSDMEGQIAVGEFAGRPALIITSRVSDTDYNTYIYEYEGCLKELMCRQDVSLGPEAGQDILEVSEFSLTSVNENLINCRIAVDEEQAYDLFISIHSGGVLNEE